MSALHTPGPWAVREQNAARTNPSVVGADGSPVASCSGNAPGHFTRSPESYERREANARLIAAAPELLEALRNLAGQAGALKAFEDEIRDAAGNTNWQCLVDAISKADTAIAQATGVA